MSYDRMNMEPIMTDSRRWAPLWAYGIPMFVLNLLRQVLVPPAEVGDAVSVALFAATALIVFVAVTTAHRLSRRAW